MAFHEFEDLVRAMRDADDENTFGNSSYSTRNPQANDSRAVVEWGTRGTANLFVAWLKKNRVPYEQEGMEFIFPQWENPSIRERYLREHPNEKRAMTNLRSATIRLAHEKPELRPLLLPLLSKTGGIMTQSMIKGIKNHMKGAESDVEKKFLAMVGDYFDEKYKTLDEAYEALDDADMKFLQKLEEFAAKENDLWMPSNHAASEKEVIAWRPAKNEDEAEWQEMMDSKAKKDRLTDADRKKIESKGGKFEKKASTKKPLYGHTDPNSAYVVDDYPYGFKLRTQAKFWLEFNSGKGYRFLSQTMDPKTGRWNKPKASTYLKFAGAMYLDEKGHVQWTGLGEYSEAAQMSEFLSDFPGADTTILKKFVPMKVKLYEKLLEANANGSSGFTINGVVQPATEADVGRNRKSLEEWTDVMKKL